MLSKSVKKIKSCRVTDSNHLLVMFSQHKKLLSKAALALARVSGASERLSLQSATKQISSFSYRGDKIAARLSEAGKRRLLACASQAGARRSM